MPKYILKKGSGKIAKDSDGNEEMLEKGKTQMWYAFFVSLKIIFTGIVGGLAFAIALMLEEPIRGIVSLWNIGESGLETLATIGLFLLIAMVFVIILIPINKKEAQLSKEI